MNEDDARFILELFWTTHDRDCSYCASEMGAPFIERFPQFEHIANEIWKEKGHNPMTRKE